MIDSFGMIFPPIVQREVRVEARNRWNHLARWIGAAGCSAIAWTFLRDAIEPSAALGAKLFGSIHTAVFMGIWLLVPALTADCVSREKREGTLGLLFLTGLCSESIVFGKGFVHMLRALTLWLAALPVLTIPFLLGGVGWADVLTAFSLQLSAMLLALSAGLIASAWSMHPSWSVFWAVSLSLGFGWAFVNLLGFVFANWLAASLPNWRVAEDFSLYLVTGGLSAGQSWSADFAKAAPAVLRFWVELLACSLLLSMLIFLLCVSAAAHRVRTLWQDKPRSARHVRWRNFWLAPRFWTRRFAAHRGSVLDRNPLGWLERYATGRRFAKLGWAGVILFVDGWLLSQKMPWTYFEFAQIWLTILLALHFAADAATLFRQERETGALELLLVTPLSVNRLIALRLAAFWKRFLPPVALAIGLSTLMIWLDVAQSPCSDFRVLLFLSYAIAPILGFWLSLRLRSFTTAFLVVFGITLGLPMLWPQIPHLATLEWPWFFYPITVSDAIPRSIEWTVRFAQIGTGVACWFALRRMLAERTFITKSELIELPVPRAVKWQSA